MKQFLILLALVAAVSAASKKSKHLISFNEENWKNMLKGEWMVEFHAPWCPACKDLQKAWNAFADWSKDLSIKVAEVDVTQNPGLSGRFLVTALPTIYHVKDGVFRHYAGVRDKEEFMQFIEEKKWTQLEPMAGWKHPDTVQMGVVAVFFRLSMKVRDLHNHLIEDRGLPAWASYSLFAGATLVLGCVLGFLIVMLIDVVFPAQAGAATQAAKDKKDKKKKDKEDKSKKEAEKKAAKDSQDEGSQAHTSQSEGEMSADEANGDLRNRNKNKKDEKKANGAASPEKKKNK